MKTSELPFPGRVREALPDITLNEPQQLAVKAGLLEGKNIVVASPTASGKTFIAELAFLGAFLRNGKAIYVCPLKALASEKYHEMKERYGKLGIKIAMSVGDFDSAGEWLGRYDLIIATSEKLDSMLRHNPAWINNVSLLIIDEVHLLNDPGRGPTLEVTMTRIMKDIRPQILALSATIKNADEIAEWLGAELVRSSYRPVVLHKGVFYPQEDDNFLEIRDKKSMMEDGEAEKVLASDTMGMQKQALLFVATRRSAEAVAEKVGKHISLNSASLSKLSKDIENALPIPTKQCKRLAACVARGAAFHHAGLVAKQRKAIEDAFRAGDIKVLSATPTLAWGINMPAYRVIIRDVKRYGFYGADYISVMEIEQMCGRAGRPAYDKEGEAILIGKSIAEAEELRKRYINGEPEPIYSKLSVEPMLRMHTLALIASEVVRSRQELEDFFSRTFFSHQYGNAEEVMEKVDRILRQLEGFGFIETGSVREFRPAADVGVRLGATKLGKKVSELYLDPLSANTIISKMNAGEMEFMTLMCTCTEMFPPLSMKKNDDFVEDDMLKSGIATPDVWDYDYEKFLAAYKTGMMMGEWMDEASENALMEKYGIAPGELYSKTKSAVWMLYATAELARLLRKFDRANDFRRLQLRMKHGVKEELLRLVSLKGVGRVRGRRLYSKGIRTPTDMKKNPSLLAEVVGQKTSAKLIEEASMPVEKK